ncbi:MAG: 3-phosphoglycerate dehydrogenase family protein [Victivallaceae bacterium]|nr:3-phosphoglycerate dehydrogenase family protein [Victivallaceae bacterium]
MHKVLIPTKLDKFAANMLSERGYTVIADAVTPLADLCKANPDTESLIVRSEAITPEIIDLLPNLKLVVRAGAGFNTIDTKYARKRNVDVMNTPGANSNGVAEEVVAMMLAVYRHVLAGDASTRAGNWEKSKFLGHEITGKTIGILGLGHIGQLLVKRLAGFEMKVLGFDPMLAPDKAKELNIELVSIEKIFAEADFVSLHIPENNETRGMINRRLLESMKPGAVLINCARAGILNEDDLRSVKAEKKIFYANDVYPKDAAGPKSIADVADIMLPHIGANTFEANFVAASRAAEQTITYFEQGITKFVVNKSVPDGLDEKYQKLAYVLASVARGYLGRKNNPVRIETSFYGDLAAYEKWLIAPLTAGIADEFTPDQGFNDAEKFLSSSGVELINRVVDNQKNYGESMTIDLATGSNPTLRVSVRGTIAEGRLMISRINNYEHLYLDAKGHHLFIEYGDKPGVIGKIAGLLGEKNINIVDMRAPQDLKHSTALCVMTTNVAVPEILLEKIRESVQAINGFVFSY